MGLCGCKQNTQPNNDPEPAGNHDDTTVEQLEINVIPPVNEAEDNTAPPIEETKEVEEIKKDISDDVPKESTDREIWEFEIMCRNRNEILINGFGREYYGEFIPADIMNLIMKFYPYIQDKFRYYDRGLYTLSNHDMTATKKGGWRETATIYGDISIPSLSNTMHEWTFKIHKIKGSSLGIGIDETTHLKINGGDFMRAGGRKYGLLCTGNKVEWSSSSSWGVLDTDLRFDTGDIVTMKLDLINATLIYNINNGQKIIAFEKITRDRKTIYCMAVCSAWKGEKVELLSYVSLS